MSRQVAELSANDICVGESVTVIRHEGDHLKRVILVPVACGQLVVRSDGDFWSV